MLKLLYTKPSLGTRAANYSGARNLHVLKRNYCSSTEDTVLSGTRPVEDPKLGHFPSQTLAGGSVQLGIVGVCWTLRLSMEEQPAHHSPTRTLLLLQGQMECGSFALIVLTFCLSLVFLYFWSEARNDYNDFDWFNFGNLGFWFPWSMVLLILAVFLFTYVAILTLLAVCLLSEGQRLYLHWCHKIGIFVTLVLSIVASSVLTDLWSKEWMTVLLSFKASNCTLSAHSYDGIPFLMHDKNLRRTTNVEEVFPNWTQSSSAMFTWRELQNLNAGSWFLYQDPFGTTSSLSPEEHLQALNQSVCSLKDFLDLAAAHGKLVIFDLYRPPRGHPYRDAWLSCVLDVIKNQSSIHSSQVLWLPPELREFAQEVDPELQQITAEKAPVDDLQMRGISRLNIHYSSMSETEIRKYAAANISTNLYVVSEPWLFSLAWCSGAHSVATNSVHILKKLRQPLFLMTPGEHRLMWVLTDITSLFLILMIFGFHWWRECTLGLSEDQRPDLENGSYRQFSAEMNNVWSSFKKSSGKQELSLK
ncbi:hypothetical protein DNTS_007827 [Danionella cerebrum]|uniref:GP-PDE domain-containing protein n=1 Tax=Danionella cerebrum TaxID=2873325 RepID=A0A553RQR1_9TELE|nr:hypothetical protein DNTS_007827 [Danionella translucida]